LSYFSELVVTPPDVNPPDTETAEDDVHVDLEFLDEPDDPARAEEPALLPFPRLMYPDEEDPYHFREPGKPGATLTNEKLSNL